MTTPPSSVHAWRREDLPSAPAAVRGVHVFPADVVVRREPAILSTVVGSCVAVCLWDSRQGGGGMCHYLLPDGPAEGDRAARFANVAVDRLVAELAALGTSRGDVVAKVFGGARMLKAFTGSHARLGERNVEAALQLLARHRIPVVAIDAGGGHGRKLRFSTADGAVALMEL